MNSPRKLTDCKDKTEDLGEELARLHCLQALFPDWTGGDAYLLNQLKSSIETTLRDDPGLEDSFENFSSLASCLREDSGSPWPDSHAFIRFDYSGKTWDPLFAQQEIIRQMKRHSSVDHVFLVVRDLRKALFPTARYRTKAREAAYEEATQFIDDLANRWSTRSAKIHLLYL